MSIKDVGEGGANITEYMKNRKETQDAIDTPIVYFRCLAGTSFSFFLKNISHTIPAIQPKAKKNENNKRIPKPFKQVIKQPPFWAELLDVLCFVLLPPTLKQFGVVSELELYDVV